VEIAPVEGLAHHLETLFSRVREGTLRLDRQASGVVSQVLDASEDCMASWSGSETTARPLAALRAIEGLLGIASQEAAEETAVEQPAPVPAGIEVQSPDTLRVSGTDLDRLLGTAGQIVTESRRQNAATEEVKETSRQIDELSRSWELFRKASVTGSGAAEDSHSMEAINQRMRSLLSQSRKAHLLQQRSVYAIGHLARQLQQDAWSARLTPAWSFVEGFGKMVRDLAREQGKEISFHVTGGDVTG
jgi:Chemotaxis protein histidine kinase and related kinases